MEGRKKKIFISYRFTGENIDVLNIVMGNVTRIFEKKGHNIFCSLYKEDYFKKHNFSRDQRYAYYKENVKNSDIVFFFIKSNDKSGGMEFELNQALKHGKKIILAIQENLGFPYFRDNAHNIIEYDNLRQFYKILEEAKF